ncbi:MAG: FkbM family methyltransferase [Rhizobiaceae bacterium]|nr:FkbM family methyltransferase [Rhizobiaceae bacterium]
MPQSSEVIGYDFNTDIISNTTTRESLGMTLMRLAAKAARPMDYTGLSHANRIIRKVLPSNRFVQVRLFEDTRFEFPYGDGYWGVLLDNKLTYSPSEEYFLAAIRDVDYAFVDCGANFGYMSSIISSDAFGKKPSIAVEADPGTFKMLQRNWELNGQRFEIKHNAVFDKSGEFVSFGGGKHEARSIQQGAIDDACNDVETIALDTLLPWIKKQKRKHLILKLDVEGVEIPALKGASKILKTNPCIMFEDHASDKSHEVSKFIMEELGMDVFYSDESGCREIHSYADIEDIKRNPRVGYDFIAAKGDFWPDLIRNLKY